MPYLFDLVYLLLLVILSPWFVHQAITKGKYRQGWAAKLWGQVPRRPQTNVTCVWLHAVSVGEVNLLAPLIEQLARERPSWQCVISTTTNTGYELARSKYPHLTVFYCPLDFSWATRRAMRRIRPRLLVLSELELWPNLIRSARRWGAGVAVINGRLSESSFWGYRRLGWLMRTTCRQIDLVCAQNANFAKRFHALGVLGRRVHVTGSVKYDGVVTDRQNPRTQQLAKLAGFSPDDIVLLAGSTQDPEEAIALDTYLALCTQHENLRLVLVPRHPERFDSVARLLESRGQRFQRRSGLETQGPDFEARVLLVDTVGELGAWWGTAHVAFVGGSLGQRGGQNMIEPAAYGAAVCFGPNTRNFRDIVEALLSHDAAVVVHDDNELRRFVARCLDDGDFARRLGQQAQQFVSTQIGASRRTTDLLVQLVGGEHRQRQTPLRPSDRAAA